MLSRLFNRRSRGTAPFAPAVPKGTAVWAVGDIHGRADLLMPLVNAMIADLQATDAERRMVIFLGDYVDRGPDSRGVIQILSSLSDVEGIEWRFLKGNHEQAMLDFLDDPSRGAKWCEYGGDRALQSYGLRVPSLAHRAEAWARVAADLRHKLPARELEFLRTLELSITVGDYFFCHAGARAGVALDRQTAEDLLWIRRPFLDSEVAFERMVVHGHTPTPVVHADRRRIGIDTKAYESGVLTALRLEGESRHVMHAAGASRQAASGAAAGGVQQPVVLRREPLPADEGGPVSGVSLLVTEPNA